MLLEGHTGTGVLAVLMLALLKRSDKNIRPWGPPDFAGHARKVFQDRAKLKQLGKVRLLTSVLVSVSLLRQCISAWTMLFSCACWMMIKWHKVGVNQLVIFADGFCRVPYVTQITAPCLSYLGQKSASVR